MRQSESSVLNGLRNKLDQNEADSLSSRACLSSQAIRRRPSQRTDRGHRQNFQVDTDRILHSLSYTRYIDKTQVFYLVDDNHITHRVLHVQLVSKIARTIGRLLRLNEDLIEAISLGHDLGHVPFGHDGEAYLSKVGQHHGLPPFIHALQSVRALDVLENGGQGLNLSLQVLDGILCHDGELDLMHLEPQPDKSFSTLEAEIEAKQADPNKSLIPMTMEGCVVRLTDTISYVGRDMEDAVRLGLISKADIPREVGRVLSDRNSTIVFRLVEDLLANSLDNDFIGFSEEVDQALQVLKDFNRERIYFNPAIKTHQDKIERLFGLLYEEFLLAVNSPDKSTDSPIFTGFLNDMSEHYLESTSPELKVRDYIARMTDDYFMKQSQAILIPGKIEPIAKISKT